MDNGSICTTASSNSVTTSYWRLRDEDATGGIITAAFLLLSILLGLPWNVLVLVTIIKEKLYHQPSIILLINLVLTDIGILVHPLPLLIVTDY